jgi:hypothetical protein
LRLFLGQVLETTGIQVFIGAHPSFASLHETVAKIWAFAARKRHFHEPFPRAHHTLHVRHDDLSKADQDND